MWEKCGYISLTKDRKKITVMVKHVHYIANLGELKAVLDGKVGFTGIYEHINLKDSNKPCN